MRLWFKGDPTVPVTPEVAAKILGERNVLLRPELGDQVFYSRDVLTFCAKQNRRKRAKWRLVGKSGGSFFDLLARYPTELAHSRLWSKMPAWMRQQSRPGYRLINLALTPLNRGRTIDESTQPYHPSKAHLVTVAEALLGFKTEHGDRYLARGFHCGDEIDDEIPFIGAYHDLLLLFSMPKESVTEILRTKKIYGTVMCIVPQQKTAAP